MDDQTKKQIQTAAEALLKAKDEGTLTSEQCTEFLEKYGKTVSADFTAEEQPLWLRVREAIAVANDHPSDLLASNFEFPENPENASTAAQPNPAETAEAAPVANPPAGTSGSTPSAESSSAGGWSLTDTAAEAWNGFKKAAAPIVEPVVKAVTEAVPEIQETVTRAYIQNKLAEYGIKPKSSGKFLDLLKDNLGVTASMIGSFAGGTKDFFAEAFSSKELYSAASPLYTQSSDRLFANHRGKALADLSERQTQNGIRNLKKLFPSMSDVSARGIVEFMESGLPKAVIDGVLPAVFQQFGDQDGRIYQLFKENYNGILHGFQGNGVQFFDTLARGNYSPGDNMAFGTAAQLASRGPSADNYFAKAENYTAALERMKAQGFRPEAHLIRGDNDLVRLTGELTDADRQQYIKQEKARAIEAAFRNEKLPIVYQEDGSINYEETKKLSEDRSIHPLIEAGDVAATQAAADLEAARSNNLNGMSQEGRVSLQAFASGAALYKRTDERQKAEQMVSQAFSWVPGAQKVFGGQPVDQRAAQQLIAVLGGSDPNGNYMDYARRAVEIGQIAANNDMDLERVISGVSEAGRYGQSLGLSPESVQSTALMGMRMFDNALANTGRSDLVDKDALFALSMQNATRVSASRQAETITWLMNADVTGNAADIKTKLNNGEALTDGDLEYLDNRENLRKDFNGDESKFTASWSSSNLDVYRRNLTPKQETAVQQNALRANQKEMYDSLGDREAESFKNRVSESAAAALGYGNSEAAWDLSKKLFKAGFSSDKISELMSGSRELTDEEAKRLEENLPAEDAAAIKQQLSSARQYAKSSPEYAKEYAKSMRLGVEAGWEAVAIDRGFKSAKEMDTANISWNEKLQRQRSIQEHLQESVPMYQWTAVETFFNTEGGRGKGAGAFVKALFGGSGVTPEAVQGLVGDDHTGIQALLHAASNDAKTKEDFFKVLTNSENTDDWNKLAKEAGYADPDALFNAVQNADVEELTDISKKVAGTKAGRGIEKLIRETDYNQVRTWKKLPFQSFADELTEPTTSSEEAPKEASENASTESVPDFINLEAPATNPSEVTPAAESSDPSGTSGQTAANRRGSTQDNPLFVIVTNAVPVI